MARSYLADDRRLLQGETDRIERIELWWDSQAMPDWYVVTKMPLRDREGNIAGVMGLLRHPGTLDRAHPVMARVDRAVEYIRQHQKQRLSISEVAAACGQWVRQLQRHFQSSFGITPQEFLIKTRVLTAHSLLLNSDLTMKEIATQSGFQDVGLFIRHFRKRVGQTPLAYRNRRLPSP